MSACVCVQTVHVLTHAFTHIGMEAWNQSKKEEMENWIRKLSEQQRNVTEKPIKYYWIAVW